MICYVTQICAKSCPKLPSHLSISPISPPDRHKIRGWWRAGAGVHRHRLWSPEEPFPAFTPNCLSSDRRQSYLHHGGHRQRISPDLNGRLRSACASLNTNCCFACLARYFCPVRKGPSQVPAPWLAAVGSYQLGISTKWTSPESGCRWLSSGAWLLEILIIGASVRRPVLLLLPGSVPGDSMAARKCRSGRGERIEMLCEFN
ncbi:hypothetical protein QBC34DRAFT_881 [Podospora aff. communis PSN243]|uniref:Uncharacterized protein n=1 Tax=Podospora aff. communis PSN243 TaxID=3040156 RepID=A0AAV9H558_9PEZI|nr:hypothetical protein QBC34DRAFT_881 [Podospora aff. communis PSN243]